MKRQHAGWYKISFDQYDMEGLSDYFSYDYLPYTYVAVGGPLRGFREKCAKCHREPLFTEESY